MSTKWPALLSVAVLVPLLTSCSTQSGEIVAACENLDTANLEAQGFQEELNTYVDAGGFPDDWTRDEIESYREEWFDKYDAVSTYAFFLAATVASEGESETDFGRDVDALSSIWLTRTVEMREGDSSEDVVLASLLRLDSVLEQCAELGAEITSKGY